MLTNATATFRRPAVGYDADTGRRTAGDEDVIAANEPVLYTPERFGKRVYHGNTLAEHVKTFPKLSVPNTDFELKPGDLCDLTYAGRTETFVVESPELCPGIVDTFWQAELSRVRTP
jgi:hypothetical protein